MCRDTTQPPARAKRTDRRSPQRRSSFEVLNQSVVGIGAPLVKFIKGRQPTVTHDHVNSQLEVVSAIDSVICDYVRI